jgi:hypothetical protein
MGPMLKGLFGGFGQRNHNPAMRVLALRMSAHACRVDEGVVHNLAVGRVHWFKHARLTCGNNVIRDFQSKTAQSLAAALTVATNINTHMGVVVAEAALAHYTSEVLHGHQCGTALTNEYGDVIAQYVDIDIFAVQRGCDLPNKSSSRQHSFKKCGRSSTYSGWIYWGAFWTWGSLGI